MKVLEWYIDSNGFRNRNAPTYTYPTAIRKYLTYLPSAQCRYFDMHLGRSKQDAQPAKENNRHSELKLDGMMLDIET